MALDYLQVFEAVVAEAKRAKIPELPASMFVIQHDALERLRDEDDDSTSAFADAAYTRTPYDNSFVWILMFLEDSCMFRIENAKLIMDFESYTSEKTLAREIFTICQAMSNGQVRVLSTYTMGSKRLATEIWYSEGRESKPLGFAADSVTRFMTYDLLRRNKFVLVQQNRSEIDLVKLPPTCKIFDAELAAGSKAADRTIDWSEPETLEYSQLETIFGEQGFGWQVLYRRVKHAVLTLLVSVFYWQSWVFVLFYLMIVGTVGSFSLPLSDLLFYTYPISYLVFVYRYLPRLSDWYDEKRAERADRLERDRLQREREQVEWKEKWEAEREVRRAAREAKWAASKGWFGRNR